MNKGFSLVELSIVLVILGLLTGGILAGQALIRAAELRAVPSEHSRYVTAVGTFRDKYFAIPGDFSKATSFWGSLGGASNDGACNVIESTDARTCDGDASGNLVDGPTSINTSENYRFWQHLANAGLIEGNYTGSHTTGAVIGRGVPGSRMSNARWTVSAYGAPHTGSISIFGGDWHNYMTLNAVGFATGTSGTAALKAEEAWNIDTKMDDGVPGIGKIVANKGLTMGNYCTSAANIIAPGDAGATYMLTRTAKECYLNFLRAF